MKEKISQLENKISVVFPAGKESKLKKLIGRNCELQLLYQMKRDGNSCATFHEKVDNQGPTITLFETQD